MTESSEFYLLSNGRVSGKLTIQAMVKGKDIDRVLGQVVKEIRLSKNLSQEKLAELGEFERSYISKVETGARSIQFITVVRLANALEIKPSELVKKFEKHFNLHK
jgi:ribosome-binding protein aMBF1 (putative translation factor)